MPRIILIFTLNFYDDTIFVLSTSLKFQNDLHKISAIL